jgi:hypothetical protein
MALTPEERHAINDLFAKLQAQSLDEKDSEAEALINQLMRRTPDSAYMLVQSVLVQEAAIEELEAQIGDLEAQLSGNRRPASGGGFLGGARRGSASMPRDDERDDRRSAIPPIGSRSGPSAYEPAYDRSSTPMGSRGREPLASPGAPQPQGASGSGGFFRTAAAMATGVVGGTLLANSLGGLFGGQKSGDAHAGQQASATTPNEASHQDGIDNDPGNYDAHSDDPDLHDAGVEDGDWGAGLDDLDI